MRIIEAWRMKHAEELFPTDDPTELLLSEFPRFAAYFNNIKRYGDTALAEYLALDGLSLDDLMLPVELPEHEEGMDEDALPDDLDEEYLSAAEQAITRIINFYQHQKIQSWFVTPENDEIIGQKFNSIERVAVLMPRTWKFAPITLMMSIIPAIIAGTTDLFINLPPAEGGDNETAADSLFLWICRKLGISQIFRLPEVPAAFAFALGTARVPRVDKIVGAGSPDVRAATALVSNSVGVKVLSDRNETTILADASANEQYIVADIFAVAEDPSLTRLTLLTTSMVKATEITGEIDRKLKDLGENAARIKEIINGSGSIVLVKDIEEALDFIVRFPPKHLSLFVQHPMDLLARVRNAGVLYLGDHSPAGMENYFASASNLIPSGRSCRYSSPLDVYDFLKKTSIVHYSKRQVEHVYNMINALADKDNLPFHRESFRIRMEQ